MAMAWCRECKAHISTEAKTCPQCGAANPTTQPASAGPLGGVIFLVFVAVLIWIWVTDDSSADPPTAVEAYSMCQMYVTDRLTSPSSADYPSGSDRFTVDLGGGKFRVSSFVDSQNGFGAMLRTQYECTIQHVAETDDWSLVNLQTH